MKKYLLLGLFLVSFAAMAESADAATLVGTSNTLSTSRPSPSSPLSANRAAGQSSIAIFNNGSRFLASDSAKFIRTPTNTLINTGNVVSSQSASLTNVFLGNTIANAAQAGTDVLFVPITAMHTIRFTTITEIPNLGDIVITFPSLETGDANNEASPSASTFQFNNLDANAATHIQIVDDGTNITGNTTRVATNPSGAGDGGDIIITVNTGTIAAGSVVEIFLGCTAISGGACSTQSPRIINPTKTATAGTADNWKINVTTRDAADSGLDSATIAVGVIDSVYVEATVDPTLTFIIAGINNASAINTGNPGCAQTETTNSGINTTSTVVNLGILANTPAINTKISNISAQLITVSTNAAGGFVLTATSSGSLRDPSNGYAIGSSTTPAAFSPNTEWFGIHACGADVAPAVWVESGSGTACSTEPAGSTANECYYGWPTQTSAITLASDPSGPIDNSVGGNGLTSVSYAAGVDGSVPAGTYQTHITYVATPTF